MTMRLACLTITQYTERNKHKIVLNRDDDKRLVEADDIT